jgi:hypothetical protein
VISDCIVALVIRNSPFVLSLLQPLAADMLRFTVAASNARLWPAGVSTPPEIPLNDSATIRIAKTRTLMAETLY